MNDEKEHSINMLSEEEIIEKIKEDVALFLKLNDKWKNNMNIAREAFEIDDSVYQFCGEEVRNNKDFALYAIKLDMYCFKHIGQNLRNDKKFIKEAFEVANDILAYINENDNLFEDKDFAKEILEINGRGIEFFKIFQEDEELVEIAVQSNPLAILSVPKHFLSNRKIVALAVSGKGDLLNAVDKKFLEDKEIAFLALSSNISALSYLDELKKDKEFILKTIDNLGKKDSTGFKKIFHNRYFLLIDKNLQKDKDVILKALKNDFAVEKFIDKEIMTDKNFLYSIRNIVEKNSDGYPEYNNLLKAFEREDKMLSTLNKVKKEGFTVKKKRI